MTATAKTGRSFHTIPLQSFLILGLIFSARVCVSQSLEIVDSLPVEGIREVSIDRKGQLLYSDRMGNIMKIDRQGNILHTFSPDKPGKVSLMEAWPTLRIFIFYREPQEYLFLDRFLVSNTRYTLRNNVGFISMATTSNDNGLWLIDDSDYALKKMDLNFNKVVVNTSLSTLPLPEKPEINYMREYQNMLYVNDIHSGILVFDMYGNYLKTLPFKGLEYFNFLGEELYFLRQDRLHFFHLYDFREREIPIPEDKAYGRLLITGKLAYLISESGIDFARITDEP